MPVTASTLFPDLGFGSSWADRLLAHSPVESRNGRLYKREDYFAPLGYGGINGAKLRQLIFLVGRYVADGGTSGVITAASVLSPQVSMAALVARHFGLPCTVVLGGTSPETYDRHPNVRIALAAGADFRFASVGYNPTLQRSLFDLAASEYSGRYILNYGITTPKAAAREAIAAFHDVGATQVENLPAAVETLLVPFGSGNSATSILYGVARHRPLGLRRIILFGIGPDKRDWMLGRLAAIESARGLPITDLFLPGPRSVDLEHVVLHKEFATYQDRMPASLDGITFHPTYEGKVVTWLARNRPDYWTRADGTTCLWIVGSEPSESAMAPFLPDLAA